MVEENCRIIAELCDEDIMPLEAGNVDPNSGLTFCNFCFLAQFFIFSIGFYFLRVERGVPQGLWDRST